MTDNLLTLAVLALLLIADRLPKPDGLRGHWSGVFELLISIGVVWTLVQRF